MIINKENIETESLYHNLSINDKQQILDYWVKNDCKLSHTYIQRILKTDVFSALRIKAEFLECMRKND
jgi:hypothetical protein